MALNTIALAKHFQTELSHQLEAGAQTGWMEANAGQVDFVGVKDVKVPQMTVSGFGNMTRGGKYPLGAVVKTDQTLTLRYDRAVRLQTDIFDIEETKGVANGNAVIEVFNRTKAVPEIDAVRHAALFSIANDGLKTGAYVPHKDTIFSQLQSDIEQVQGKIGEDYPLIVHIRSEVAAVLATSTEMSRKFELEDGEINFQSPSGKAITAKIKMLDNIALNRIVNSRMYSNITLNDGSDSEVSDLGFETNDFSMKLNWIIVEQTLPIAVKKYDNTKIVPQSINPESRHDNIIPNLYHDLFVFDNKLDGLYVSYQAKAAPTLTGELAEGSESGKTKYTATDVATGNTLGYDVNAEELTGEDLPKLNDILEEDDYTAYTSGADITATAEQYLTVYELDSNKRVVRLFQSILTDKVAD